MNPDQKYRYALFIRVILAAMFSLITGRSGFAQYDNQVLKDIADSHEKVYVQLDRMVYVAGNTLKFRAFTVDAGLLQDEIKSKILYLELAGPQIALPLMWRINLTDGNCSGSFVLPYDLKGGIYSVKAFTNWMKNGKPEYLFSADILIIEVSEEIPGRLSIFADPAQDSRIISFYPENGRLVDGITCKVGYKVNFEIDGMLPDSIEIVEEDSVIVKQIITGQQGFGSFDFVPDISKSYSARLSYPNGQATRVSLPNIEFYGYTMQTEKVAGGLNVSISAKNLPDNQQSSFRLVATSRGTSLFDSSFTSYGNKKNIFVPSGNLHKGILNITLYDSRRFVLCQRLYYHYSTESGPQINIEGMQNSYSNGETVQMELRVEGLAEDDMVSMAVSVSEQHPFQHFLQPTQIDDYFLLLSDISTESLYYSKLGEISEHQIQDLLLCVNHNDYAWNYYSGVKLPDCIYDLEENGYILNGTIRGKTGNEPLVDANILINVIDSISTRILYTHTDQTGSFYAVLNPYYDNRNIIIQVLEDFDNSDIVWEMEDKRLPEPPQSAISHTLTGAEQDYVEQSLYIRIVETVYEDDIQGISPVEKSNTGIQFLSPNSVVYPGDYTELNSFKEIADNILPAVRFTTRNQQFEIGIYDRSRETWLENDIVFLNGVLFKDLAHIATLGSKDIERIEVNSTNLMIGDLTIPGFLSIYTYDGLVPESYLSDHAYTYLNDVLPDDRNLQNATPEPETYTDTEHPDLRQTLLWAPDVKITGSDTVTIEFHTSHLDGLYDINIQGISCSGIPMHKNFVFSVK